MSGVMMLVFWVAFSVGVGLLAGSRGRSVFGFFLLSLITSPLLGLIVVLVIADKRKEAELREKEQSERLTAQEAHEETIRAIMAAGQSQRGGQESLEGKNPAVSVADELEKLVRLRDSGAITEGEFIRLKLEVLRGA